MKWFVSTYQLLWTLHTFLYSNSCWMATNKRSAQNRPLSSSPTLFEESSLSSSLISLFTLVFTILFLLIWSTSSIVNTQADRERKGTKFLFSLRWNGSEFHRSLSSFLLTSIHSGYHNEKLEENAEQTEGRLTKYEESDWIWWRRTT